MSIAGNITRLDNSTFPMRPGLKSLVNAMLISVVPVVPNSPTLKAGLSSLNEGLYALLEVVRM